MKSFFKYLLFAIVIAIICFVAGYQFRPEVGDPEIISDTTIVRDTIIVKADSGKIYADMKLQDPDFISYGIAEGKISYRDTIIDSLYSCIDTILGKKEIIAHTKIDVKEGAMDISYLLSKRIFLWNWQAKNLVQEIQVININTPIYPEKKWYERWYVTIPIGFIIGYGLEKVL